MEAILTNIKGLEDVGDLAWFQIKDVLQRLESPEQLHKIEKNSPQIRGDDVGLWKKFIARDFPRDFRTKNYFPKNDKNWYGVYKRYKKEEEEKIEADKEALRTAMMGLQQHKASHVSKFVDPKTVPKLPRDPRMLPNNGGVPIGGKKRGFTKTAPSSLNFTSGSKTKTTDSASILLKARRQAIEHTARTKLATPTQHLHKGFVNKAPEGMVMEHRREQAPPLRILSTKRKISATYSGGISGPAQPSQEERENRLRALTMSGSAKEEASKPNYVSDEEDDIFGDSNRSSTSPPPQKQQGQPGVLRKGHTENQPPVKPILKPAASGRLFGNNPLKRPSELISSIVSKPKTQNSTPFSELRKTSASSSPSRAAPTTQRPGTAGSPPPKSMMPKRKAPVDVFNRSVKKPRTR